MESDVPDGPLILTQVVTESGAIWDYDPLSNRWTKRSDPKKVYERPEDPMPSLDDAIVSLALKKLRG